LILSVDWEGSAIQGTSLTDINRFRNEFPQLHFQHFLNAAYFTKPNVQIDENIRYLIRTQIRSVLRDGDELGLHLHGWYRLFNAAGVRFLRNNSMLPLTDAQCSADCGHAVPISDYSVDEIRAVLRLSKQILNENGFGEATSFRAGAWLGSPDVLSALTAEGFTSDSSAVPTNLFNIPLLEREYPTLMERLIGLWSPQIQNNSQPYLIQTDHGPILEIPNNGLLADWATPHQMVNAYLAVRQVLRRYPHRAMILSLGFHQETASQHLESLSVALRHIFALAAQDSIVINNPVFPLIVF
jgi:hypothetical protein